MRLCEGGARSGGGGGLTPCCLLSTISTNFLSDGTNDKNTIKAQVEIGKTIKALVEI